MGEEVKIIRNDGEKLQIEYGNNKVFMSCGAVTKCEGEENEDVFSCFELANPALPSGFCRIKSKKVCQLRLTRTGPAPTPSRAQK